MRRHLNSKRGCPQLHMLVEMNAVAELPDVTKTSYNKFFYQKVVETFLGKGRMNLEGSLTDVTTDTAHAKIRRWKDYATCIGELMNYDLIDPRPELHAYMFDESCGQNNIEAAVKLLTCTFGPKLKMFYFTYLDNAVQIRNYDTDDVVYEYQIAR
jgi:hypothetical protein